MTEISFYHLSISPLEKALPKLLEKVVSANKKALVLAETEGKVDKLNDLLWTYSTRTFLPHGTKKDGYQAEQPIYLTTLEEDNPANATILVITGNALSANLNNFERCLYIFDGSEEAELAAARAQWVAYKKLGHLLTYWQQTNDGGWTKANTE